MFWSKTQWRSFFKTFPLRDWLPILHFTHQGAAVELMTTQAFYTDLDCIFFGSAFPKWLGNTDRFYTLFGQQTETVRCRPFSSHALGARSSVIGQNRHLSQDWSLSTRGKLQPWKNHLYSCLLDARDIILRIAHSRQNQPDNVLPYVCLSVAVL